jgi:putative phosphoribosyl transferase
VLNEDLVRAVAPPAGYIEAEEQRQLAEIERRRQRYVGDRPPVAIEGRPVIVVDDGIATGATVKAALRGLARNRPARLVLAVPVAPADSLEELAAECDEIVCLATPDPFYAVGPHYRDFRQTEDAELVRLLDQGRQWSKAEPSGPTRHS